MGRVIDCDFVEISEGRWRCSRCGYEREKKVFRNCSGPKGLGDYVRDVTRKLRMKHCGKCGQRQRKLNQSKLSQLLLGSRGKEDE